MSASQQVTVQQPAELLKFLLATWPEAKRKTLQNWLKFRQVSVNGEAVTRFNHPLSRGDIVAIGKSAPSAPAGKIGAGIRIRHEDGHLIVIEKPSGLLSMASERERDRTAYAQLMHHARRGDPKSRERVFIVHRLDKETSGLMVFARSEEAKRFLQDHWDQTKKRYLAVTTGRPRAESGRYETHLDESDPLRVRSLPKPGNKTRHAVTEYRVIQSCERHSLVELTLVTGRRHQIRVHLAGDGCPIIGDERYGNGSNPAGRLGLHSASLEFRHPVTKQQLRFESPLPPELAKFDRW